MSDTWAVVLAVAVFAGAVAAIDGHLPPVALAVALAVLGAGWLLVRLCGHRPAVLCLGAALLASALAQRSLSGLEAPVVEVPVRTEVVLVGDPVPDGRGGVTVDVRYAGRRFRGVARQAAASALDDRLAGERITVIGQTEPPGPSEAWLRHRHIAGRLVIDTVTGWRAGGPASRLANGLRRTLAQGAESLPERQRSLLAGVTLGDDRAQPADLTDAFRAAGLTHLLAVSGQNVAFVLVIAAPLLVRLRFGPRLVATLVVLALFTLVTRAEPSVLRATAMAAVAAVGGALGRPTSSLRTLALGVAAMLLVDPLLATSIGFRLSVAGAAGLVVGARRLEAVLPGPRWLVAPLSVTLAAQAAVAPVLVAAFGSVPVASLPANLLAVPAAGPLMVWGLTGGLVAGVVGGSVARIIHLPTRLLLAWLEGVALAASRWPLGDLRAPQLAVLGSGTVMVVAGRALVRGAAALGVGDRAGGSTPARRSYPAADRAGNGRRPRPRGTGQRRAATIGLVVSCLGGGAMVLGAVMAVAPVGGGGAGPSEHELGLGATMWRAGGAAVVVLDGRARDDVVLGGLRREGIERVDLVVMRTAAHAVADVVSTLRRRWPAMAVLAPRPDGTTAGGADEPAVLGAVTPAAGTVIDIGGVRLTVAGNSGGRLDVDIQSLDMATPGGRGRSP